MRRLGYVLAVCIMASAMVVSRQAVAITQFRVTTLDGNIVFDETVTDEDPHVFAYTGGGIFSAAGANFNLIGESGNTALYMSGSAIHLNPGDVGLPPNIAAGTTLTDITSIIASHGNLMVNGRLFYARMVSEVSAAPEPISLLSLATGIGALIVVRRRTRPGRVAA